MGLWVTLKFDTHELLTYTLGTKLWQFSIYSMDSCCVTKYVMVRHSTLWENRPWLWYHEISVEILQLRWYHEIWEVCITLWHISREKRFQVFPFLPVSKSTKMGKLWVTSIARKGFFLDLEKPGLPKIFLAGGVRESQLADNTNEQQLSYIPRHVPNTCGFCDVMVEYSLLLGRYSLRV